MGFTPILYKVNIYYSFSDIRYTETSLGTPMIIMEGFKFYEHSISMGGSKVRWICGSLRRKGCKAYMTTFENEVVKLNNNHNHPSAK